MSPRSGMTLTDEGVVVHDQSALGALHRSGRSGQLRFSWDEIQAIEADRYWGWYRTVVVLTDGRKVHPPAPTEELLRGEAPFHDKIATMQRWLADRKTPRSTADPNLP